MPYEPHPAAKAAHTAHNTTTIAETVGAAAPLIALALSEVDPIHTGVISFLYSDRTVLALPIAPSFKSLNDSVLRSLDDAFHRAGWRVDSTKPEDSVAGAHVYTKPQG